MSRAGSQRASLRGSLPGRGAVDDYVVAEHANGATPDGEDELEANGDDADGGDEDEDESDGEDEYEVQAIVGHKMDKGKYKYLVSWKGYGAEHNTWEPQENVEHAEAIVREYWDKQPKNTAGNVRKRGRPSGASAAAGPSSARKSARTTAPVEVSLSFHETHTDSLERFRDVADWDELVQTIDTVERGSDNKLVVYMSMKSGERIAQSTEVANARCPQAMLKFYESHLKWRNA